MAATIREDAESVAPHDGDDVPVPDASWTVTFMASVYLVPSLKMCPALDAAQ